MKNTDIYKLIKNFGALKKGDIVARRWTMYSGNCTDTDYYCKVIDNHYDYKHELHLNLVQNNTEFFAPYCFTTKDGVDMYKGENYYYISHDDKIGVAKAHSESEATFPFSTKEAAETYLLLEEAKKKYPIGTKFISEFSDKGLIREVKPYKSNYKTCTWYWDNFEKGIRSENGLYTQEKGCSNPLIYRKGKWAEIVPSFEIGKWYNYNNEYFLKYTHSKNKGYTVRLYGETINCDGYSKASFWANSDMERDCTELKDLSIIQKYLPDGHVDKFIKIGDYITYNDEVTFKVANIKLGSYIAESGKSYDKFFCRKASDEEIEKCLNNFKVGDWIYVIDSGIKDFIGTVSKISVLEDNKTSYLENGYSFTKNYKDRHLWWRKATNQEIIAHYESLGWVKGAKFDYKTKHGFYSGYDCIVECLTFDKEGKIRVKVKDSKESDEVVIDYCTLIKEKQYTWEECYKGGYYIGNSGHIKPTPIPDVMASNINDFRTISQAQSALAFAQLSQIVAEMNEGWVADWLNSNQPKYIIKRYANKLSASQCYNMYKVLPFKSAELRDLSLKNHKSLWESYYEL